MSKWVHLNTSFETAYLHNNIFTALSFCFSFNFVNFIIVTFSQFLVLSVFMWTLKTRKMKKKKQKPKTVWNMFWPVWFPEGKSSSNLPSGIDWPAFKIPTPAHKKDKTKQNQAHQLTAGAALNGQQLPQNEKTENSSSPTKTLELKAERWRAAGAVGIKVSRPLTVSFLSETPGQWKPPQGGREGGRRRGKTD